MSVNNLYSLLNGRWFIEETYGKSFLPALYNVLNGKVDFSKDELPKIEHNIITAGSSVPMAASDFQGSNNKEEYVLVLSVKSPITKYSQFCGPQGTKEMADIMGRYESDPNLSGVVLDIDSGGGQVSGTPEFYDFILNYSKPVVSYTDGLMCSAAYYIGSAADHIVANKRTDHIGSIGTMVHFIDVSGIYEQMGGKVITEYATKSTDKNKDFEELLKGNPEGYIKNELDPITEDFHNDMKAVRENLDSSVLTGGTYNAQKSLDLGLIDEIGTLQTAIDKVFSLAQDNKGDSNINNSKQKTMSDSKTPLLEGILGSELEKDSDGGVYLNAEQLASVETNLSESESEAGTSNDRITELEASETEITNTIQEALKEAEVDGAEKMSNKEGVEALSGLVKEYGAEDGGEATQTINGPATDSKDNNIVGGIDISDAMNN